MQVVIFLMKAFLRVKFSILCKTNSHLLTHFVGLTNTMGSREGLDVIVGVPIRIINNNSVGSGQVNTQPSSTCGQQEYELLGSRCIESEGKQMQYLKINLLRVV